MTLNPYEPTSTPNLSQDSMGTPLNWRAIFVAIAICFGVGFVVGAGIGIVAFSLAMIAGPSIGSYIDNPVLMVTVFVAGLLPSVIGAIYLGRQLESRLFTHAFLYSFANFMMSAILMLIPFETDTTWTDLVYYALHIPVSIACVVYSARSHG